MTSKAYSPTSARIKIESFAAIHLGWVGMCLFAIAHLAAFAWRLVASPDVWQVQFTPDDAYYYLGLARNHALTGLWTFDAGVSTTSGFHPMLAYLLSLIYRVTQPSTHEFVRYGMLLTSGIALALSIWVGYLGLVQRRYPHFVLFLALLLASRNYALNAVSIMEWSLTLLFATLYVGCFARSYATGKPAYLSLLLLGMGGSLSRSDFGLWPLSIFAAAVVGFAIFREKLPRTALLTALAGLVGATLGVALVFVHNFLLMGSFLQSSARMKSYWSQLSGPSYEGALFLLRDALGWSMPGAGLLAIVLMLGIALLPFIRRGLRQYGVALGRQQLSQRVSQEALLDLLLVTAALICLGGYFWVYSRNGDVQRWYTANMLVPVFLTLVIGTKYLALVVARRQMRLITLALTLVVLALMARNTLSLHSFSSNLSGSRVVPPWPHQAAMLAAGQYLQERGLEGRTGAWNAGIIGYYQGGQVVNLDGLVNDDIYAYAVSNTLPVYVAQNDIRYIVDFAPMLTSHGRRLRGGYDDAAFIARLQPVKVFDYAPENEWKNLTLYKVLP